MSTPTPSRKVQDYIAAGDVYQINLTLKYRFAFSGDPVALYSALRRKQRVEYGALIGAGEFQRALAVAGAVLPPRGQAFDEPPDEGHRAARDARRARMLASRPGSPWTRSSAPRI